jgi:hypothetical protein
MILISKTYEIITEESAENGEAAESGFIWEDAELTFKELVGLLQNFPDPSCWPLTSDSADGSEWFGSNAEQDFRTGDYESEAIHYSLNNHPRSLKYWKKAIRYVFRK